MLMTREKRLAIRTLRGWAISVLLEAGAIRECEEHGWMQDRADPHARERAFEIALRDPPAGVSGAPSSPSAPATPCTPPWYSACSATAAPGNSPPSH